MTPRQRTDQSKAEALTARRAATRRAILDAAESLLADFGYAQVSPADVAAAIGIGRTTFYEYFTDMEDLLAALVEQRLPEVTELILTAIPRQLSCRAQLSELALRTIEFSVTDPVFGMPLHRGLPTLSAPTQARIGAAHRALSAEFGRIYTAGVDAGEFRGIPGPLAAALVGDTILAAAKTLMTMPDPKSHLHQVGDECLRFLFNGLGPVTGTTGG